MHGVLATTMPVGPVIVCSGPGTRAIGMNSGVNALGQGNRANSTIGRAVQLVVRNVGGGRPGEIDRATHGNPGKLGFCFAENDVESPFGTLAGQLGIDARCRRRHRVRRRRPALRRRPAVAYAREPGELAGRAAPGVHHHKLRDGVRRRPRDGSRARPRVRRRRVGPRSDPVRAAHAADHAGSELERGAGGIAEGDPAGFDDVVAARSSRPTA